MSAVHCSEIHRLSSRATVEGSREVILKGPHRDPSASLRMTKDELLAAEYVLQPLTKLAEQKSERCAWILFEHFHDTRT
jgi:hypothetical protein